MSSGAYDLVPSSNEELELEDMVNEDSSLDRAPSKPRRRPPYHLVWLLLGISLCSLGIYSHNHFSRGWPESLSYLSPPPPIQSQVTAVTYLFASQPHTLSAARARYSLQNQNFSPPPQFDAWFNFTQRKGCLVDAYHQIYHDFAPFYDLEENEPGWFKRRVEKLAQGQHPGVKIARVQGGRVFMEGRRMWVDRLWMTTLNRFAAHLPNMTFVLNERDEPRIVFNYRIPGALDRVHNITEDDPFRIHPSNTADFFRDQHCIKANDATGFPSSVNEDTAFLLNSASSDFTTDLYPILSQTRMSPCFADIMIPSQYYYPGSGLNPPYLFPDNITWTDKKSQIYWRGRGTGGMVAGSNYHRFPRFRILDIARAHPDLMDVALTDLTDSNCRIPCNPADILHEYNMTRGAEPHEDGYAFKYALDLDGNSFSGRFLGLMKTGSLVFKATVFDEYWNAWLRPYEHYIPVQPDLSDLVARIEWAKANDGEAKRIQEAGQAMAEALGTEAQNDCYFFGALLEWARLQGNSGRKG